MCRDRTTRICSTFSVILRAPPDLSCVPFLWPLPLTTPYALITHLPTCDDIRWPLLNHPPSRAFPASPSCILHRWTAAPPHRNARPVSALGVLYTLNPHHTGARCPPCLQTMLDNAPLIAHQYSHNAREYGGKPAVSTLLRRALASYGGHGVARRSIHCCLYALNPSWDASR